MDTFTTDLNKSQVLGKIAVKRGDYGQLCKNLNIPFDIKPKEENDNDNEVETNTTTENTPNNAPQATEMTQVGNDTTDNVEEPHAA